MSEIILTPNHPQGGASDGRRLLHTERSWPQAGHVSTLVPIRTPHQVFRSQGGGNGQT